MSEAYWVALSTLGRPCELTHRYWQFVVADVPPGQIVTTEPENVGPGRPLPKNVMLLAMLFPLATDAVSLLVKGEYALITVSPVSTVALKLGSEKTIHPDSQPAVPVEQLA